MGKTLFITKNADNLVITMIPSRQIVTDGGIVTHTPAKRIEFQGDRYATEDPQEIAYIQSRMRLGTIIIEITPEEQEKIKEEAAIEREVRKEIASRRERKETPAETEGKPDRRR